MKKRIIYDNEKVIKEDLNLLQDYIYESIYFILEDIITYENFFTGDNLTVNATDPASMSVTVSAGDGYFNYKVAYLPTDTNVDIDPAGASDRTDLITAKASEVEDELTSRWFIDPVTEEEGFQNVTNRKIYKYEIKYYPDTTEVPEGEVGLAEVFVAAEATEILQTDITDIRPQKPSQDLTAHRTATPIDHPDGSINNAKISATADIALSKLSGQSVDTLLELLFLEEILPMTITFQYSGDKLIGYTAVGEKSHNATITYDEDDFVVNIEKDNGSVKRKWSFTYGDDGNVATATLEDTPI